MSSKSPVNFKRMVFRLNSEAPTILGEAWTKDGGGTLPVGFKEKEYCGYGARRLKSATFYR
jgi:hypothetical protein